MTSMAVRERNLGTMTGLGRRFGFRSRHCWEMKPICARSWLRCGKSRPTLRSWLLTIPMPHPCRPAVESRNTPNERISYRGLENSYRISNAAVELVVLADVGPRILSYGFIGDKNIFHEVPEQAGLTVGSDFRLYGGHRLWIWPGGRAHLFSRQFSGGCFSGSQLAAIYAKSASWRALRKIWRRGRDSITVIPCNYL